MGKSYTPKHRIEFTKTVAFGVQPICWSTKVNGKATRKNLEKYIAGLNKSFQIGGSNEHLSRDGVLPHIIDAKLVNQFTGEIVAEYKTPLISRMKFET